MRLIRVDEGDRVGAVARVIKDENGEKDGAADSVPAADAKPAVPPAGPIEGEPAEGDASPKP